MFDMHADVSGMQLGGSLLYPCSRTQTDSESDLRHGVEDALRAKYGLILLYCLLLFSLYMSIVWFFASAQI